MGLAPDHWGPHLWAAIHLICLGAPETLDASQQQAYRDFFHALPSVLPCVTCAEHLRANLKTIPIDNALASNTDLFSWSVNLHNLVNSQLKKPNMTLDVATKQWKTPCRSSCVVVTEQSKKVGAVLPFTIGLVIGLAFMYGLLNLNKLKRR